MKTDSFKKALYEQLALDYCVTPEEVADHKNHFSIYEPLEGRRLFRVSEPCVFRAAVVNGKILFSGTKEIMDACRERYGDVIGDWYLDVKRFRELEKIVAKEGVVLGSAHPFYLPDPGFTPLTPAPDLEIRWFEGDAIEAFRGDKRYTNAYSFDEAAPDMIGVGAYVDGRCIGMAGASADSPTLWQIGIDVDKASRGRHVGATLVSLLKEEIIKKGHTPFYGTSMSNIASQRVAHHSGFVVAWAELSSDRAG